ncbi:hypothetical protein [Acinetobacter lactucae]|uniref:hypothetical protein n=1 Tax=Acinetobacter lactucae TaxID=1785128 RepID=UPI0015806B7B|nr:hypothetical protein [Acinetobacter lactucae]NUG49668.1 hypothetical protein [Acinetobacter lactucae]
MGVIMTCKGCEERREWIKEQYELFKQRVQLLKQRGAGTTQQDIRAEHNTDSTGSAQGPDNPSGDRTEQ